MASGRGPGAKGGYYTSESVGIRLFRSFNGFENQPRSIAAAGIEVLAGHVAQCSIPLFRGVEPVESFPVRADESREGVACRKTDPDTVGLGLHRFSSEIVSVANFHGWRFYRY